MHAIMITLDIDAGRADEAVALLSDMVVPMAKSLAGFKVGYWMRSDDHTKGLALELYESRAAAETALRERPAPPPDLDLPWTLASGEILEIAAST